MKKNKSNFLWSFMDLKLIFKGKVCLTFPIPLKTWKRKLSFLCDFLSLFLIKKLMPTPLFL